MWREIGEGLRWVFGNPYLRPIQAASMSFICANSVWGAVYILFLTRELRIEPALIGLIFAAGGPGALLGSAVAGPLTLATMRSLNWSTVTAGALIGGTLGDSIGLTPTLLIGTVGSLLSSLWLIFSPVRQLRDVPD